MGCGCGKPKNKCGCNSIINHGNQMQCNQKTPHVQSCCEDPCNMAPWPCWPSMPCADNNLVLIGLDGNGCPKKLTPVDQKCDGILIYKDCVASVTDHPCVPLAEINGPKHLLAAGATGCWGFFTGETDAGVVLWNGVEFYVNQTLCLPSLPKIVSGQVVIQNEDGCFSNFANKVGFVVSDGSKQYITTDFDSIISGDITFPTNVVINEDLTVEGDVIFNGQLCTPNLNEGAIVSTVGLNADGCLVKGAAAAPSALARVIKTAHDNGQLDIAFNNPGAAYVPVPNLVGDAVQSVLTFTNLGATSSIRISYDIRAVDVQMRIVLDGAIVYGLDQMRQSDAGREWISGSYEINVAGAGLHTAQLLVRNNPAVAGPFNLLRCRFQIAGFASEIS